MMVLLSSSSYYLVEFATLYAILLVLAVLAVVWFRVIMVGLAKAVRAANRRGWYEPELDDSTDVERQATSEWLFISFSTILQFICRILPGDPRRHTYTIAIPVVFGLLAVFTIIASVIVLLPLEIYTRLAGPGSPEGSSTVAAGAVAVYYASLYGGLRCSRRIARWAKGRGYPQCLRRLPSRG